MAAPAGVPAAVSSSTTAVPSAAPAASAAPMSTATAYVPQAVAAARAAPSYAGDVPSSIMQIAALNPYTAKWTIRARVTQKARREYTNAKGVPGRLFNVNLLDDTGEIKATGFNETCDLLFDQLELGKVYYITKCTLKNANKQFNQLKHPYEMYFESGTSVIINSPKLRTSKYYYYNNNNYNHFIIFHYYSFTQFYYFLATFR